MHKRIPLGLILISLCIILSACYKPESPLQVSQTGGATTWIDAPLNGTVLPPQTSYPVVVHAFDPYGVAQLELSANGALITTLTPSSAGNLATFNYEWLPQQTGNVTLLARAQGKNGLWNSSASVQVTIGEITPTTVITITPTTTATPTPTVSTPTLTPTNTPTPTATTQKELEFTAQFSTNQIYYGGCGTNAVTVQGQVSDPASVRSLVVFTKVQDQGSGSTTGWDAGTSMNSTGNGWYQVTLYAESIPNYNAYDNSWLLIQFVATGDGGAVIGRSQNFSDVALTGCPTPVPPGGITPVRPPV